MTEQTQPQHMRTEPARSQHTEDSRRRAIAALMRIGEPGDGLLGGLVTAIGPIAALDLITAVADRAASAQEAAAGLATLIADLPGAGQLVPALDRWAVRAPDARSHDDVSRVAAIGGRLVIPTDADWPEGLDDLGPAAPLGLWVRGPAGLVASLDRAVAVVGARAASGYGVKCASDLAWDLAARGVCVVSGGAFGIDAAAHRAALAAESVTIAFMAGGVDRFYPQANAELFERILDQGALVSETAPGMTPMRHRFLLRNRLIAASAQVTVVVEAGWRSGALNTARHAGELSRRVACFPGSVFSAASAGAHRLIRRGEAELVTGSEDVLELLAPATATGQTAMGQASATGQAATTGPVPEDAPPSLFDADCGRADDHESLRERERICLNALSTTQALDPGTVATRAGLTVEETLSALAVLELEGLSTRGERGWTKLRRRS